MSKNSKYLSEFTKAYKSLMNKLPIDIKIECLNELEKLEEVCNEYDLQATDEISWYHWMKEYGMKKGYITKPTINRMEEIQHKYHLAQ